jgi:hypothetical protein
VSAFHLSSRILRKSISLAVIISFAALQSACSTLLYKPQLKTKSDTGLLGGCLSGVVIGGAAGGVIGAMAGGMLGTVMGSGVGEYLDKKTGAGDEDEFTKRPPGDSRERLALKKVALNKESEDSPEQSRTAPAKETSAPPAASKNKLDEVKSIEKRDLRSEGKGFLQLRERFALHSRGTQASSAAFSIPYSLRTDRTLLITEISGTREETAEQSLTPRLPS